MSSSRRLIRKTAEANPKATVVVTGCYAVADPEAVRAIPGVDLVVDNDGKDRLAELVTAVPGVRRLPLVTRPAPVGRGVREVVLTGVHLGKYGDDRGERDALARLVDRLTAVEGLLRLRLSSVLPVQVTPQLV